MVRVHCTELKNIDEGERWIPHTFLVLRCALSRDARYRCLSHWTLNTERNRPLSTLLNMDCARMHMYVWEREFFLVYAPSNWSLTDTQTCTMYHLVFWCCLTNISEIFTNAGVVAVLNTDRLWFSKETRQSKEQKKCIAHQIDGSVYTVQYTIRREPLFSFSTSSGTLFVSLSIFVIVKCFKSYGLETKLFCSQQKKKVWTTKNTKHQMPNTRNQLNM